MLALSPPPTIPNLNPLVRNRSVLPNDSNVLRGRRLLVVQCGNKLDLSNPSSFVTSNDVMGASRADWQSSCAILASKVVSEQQEAERTDGTGKITAVNLHQILDLFPIENLPKPLATDLSSAPQHGSHLRVAYQEMPGAYSEAAAGEAYPGCEAIPCDQFEVAFQVVELWIAESAVLPVENSLGGSIHWNYDLLLRHRHHTATAPITPPRLMHALWRQPIT